MYLFRFWPSPPEAQEEGQKVRFSQPQSTKVGKNMFLGADHFFARRWNSSVKSTPQDIPLGSVPGNVFKSELERQKFDARRISRGPDRVKGFQIGIQEAIWDVWWNFPLNRTWNQEIRSPIEHLHHKTKDYSRLLNVGKSFISDVKLVEIQQKCSLQWTSVEPETKRTK